MFQPPCRTVNLDQIIEEVSSAKRLIEYVQTTGGEPLLQVDALAELFRFIVENIGLKTSLNSNLTLFSNFRKLVEKDLVKHVATDLKIPFKETTGVSKVLAEAYWRNYLSSLKLIKEHSIELELRIPVLRGITMDAYEAELGEALNIISSMDNLKIIIQPVKGEPHVEPRCMDWCLHKCNPLQEDLENVKKWFIDRGFTKVFMRL